MASSTGALGGGSGDGDDYTVEWSLLPHQEIISAAFAKGEGETSVMLYGAEKLADVKVDLGRLYAKGREGERRPVVFVSGGERPGEGEGEGEGGREVESGSERPRAAACWEFNYGEGTEWARFDDTDADFLSLSKAAGRRTGVLYDGPSCVEYDLSEGVWSNVLCEVEENRGYLREAEDSEIVDAAEGASIGASPARRRQATLTATVTAVPAASPMASAVPAAAAAAETAPISTTQQTELLMQLKEMGFDEDRALQALFDENFSLDGAISKLIVQ